MCPPIDTHCWLVADIGGTNTRTAIVRDGRVDGDTVTRFRNAEYNCLEDVLSQYQADQGQNFTALCVAAAGPVEDGRVKMTNLDWLIDSRSLADAVQVQHAFVLNDLQAQGYALDDLSPDHIVPVLGGPSDGPKLVVGVGTGFNATFVQDVPGGKQVTASECGHMSLPVQTIDELEMSLFIRDYHGFCSVEDVVSGRGLELVHQWLVRDLPDAAPAKAADILGGCSTAGSIEERAAQMFCHMLGRVCGDLALVHLPRGGLFLVGGVARAFAAHFSQFGFAKGFRDKGRFGDFMAQFPVFIVKDDYAALIGSARFLEQKINQTTAKISS
ncbi:glucokinase [Pseudaestuariivita rosea]|uniref:glucokinase n=1 Tax=Pseudaestuariivita rosea TaxID=2763263 RepID=UPI001ABB44EA|nr:glucokinase [Pseudaestuariivita rosea]